MTIIQVDKEKNRNFSPPGISHFGSIPELTVQFIGCLYRHAIQRCIFRAMAIYTYVAYS